MKVNLTANIAWAFVVSLLLVSSTVHAQSAGLPARTKYITKQVEALEAQLDGLNQSREDFKKQRADLKLIYEKLQKEQDEQGISGESFPDVIKSLQSQRVELMIDLAGMEARRAAIFELKKEMAKESQDVIEQLSELLKVEEERMAQTELLVKSNTASRGDLQKAKSRLLEVKIRLAEARKPSKGQEILNDGLLNTSLDRAEKKARLEKTETLLNTFTASRKMLEDTNTARGRLSNSERRIASIESSIEMVNSQIEKYKAQLKELKKNYGSEDN